MKLLISLALLAAAQGFVVNPEQGRATKLHVATPPMEDFSSKPIPKYSSTESVPVKKVSMLERAMMKDRVIDPDYRLALGTFLLGPLIAWYHPSYMADGTPSLIGVFGAGFHMVFAALLYSQTTRVRLVFGKDHMEFFNVKGKGCDLKNGGKLVKKPSNYVAGTPNKWYYDDITNYGFFPSLEFPVICYMKETGTDEKKWNRWFAAFDSYGRGQPHFFPGICDAYQIKEEYEKRGIKRKPVKTLKDMKN